MNTDALTNLFNWIVLTIGVDMSGSEMLVQYSPTPASPRHYWDVTFTIRDRSAEALAEVDFRLLHALVIALKPAGNVTIGVVEGYETDANLSIGLDRIYVNDDDRARPPSAAAYLDHFQMLAIDRLGGCRPYERPAIMHRDQSK